MSKKAKETVSREIGPEPRVERPWGYYQTIERDHGLLVKRIVVKPGSRLSL